LIKRLASSAGILLICLSAQAESITLDIRPGDPDNFVDTASSSKSLQVAVLTTQIADGESSDFDATTIDPQSVRFGPDQAAPDANYLPSALTDVDGDGDNDLSLNFPIPATGIACEETSAAITGSTYLSTVFSGSDSITTPDCPNCHAEEANYRETGKESYFVAEDSQLQVTEAAIYPAVALEENVSNGNLTLAGDGSFSYTPAADFFGLDKFSYRDANNTLTVVDLSVTNINDPPIADDDSASVAKKATLLRNAPGVLSNDRDVDGDALEALLMSSTSHGALNLNPDGSFEYIPGPDFPGTDSFVYRVTDGQSFSDGATVEITLPNVLLIMVDDMGQGDAQIYNPGSAIPMPNLTALAQAGIRFDNAHSATAACSPTRYSLLTGNYPYRGRRSSGVWKTLDPDTMIVPGQQTLGHTMQAANYRTAFIGKLHNGGAFWNEAGTDYTTVFTDVDFSRPFDRGPTQFGFDYSFLLPGGADRGPYSFFENDRLVRYDDSAQDFLPFGNAGDARAHLLAVSNNQNYNGGKVGIAGRAMDNYDSRKIGTILTSQALEFIDEHLADNRQQGAARPFFLYMATPEPHTPWTPPPVFNAAQPHDIDAGSPGTPIANATPVSERTDIVFETDVILGTLLAKLDDEGILNDTLIIFTSDNGVNNQLTQAGYDGTGERIESGPGGAQHINAQGVVDGVPLRGYKLQIYEGGHKAPMIMRWGDGTESGSVISPGRAVNQLIGSQDIMATLADIADVELAPNQANDSYSFWPILFKPSWRRIRDHMIVQGMSSQSTGESGGRALYKFDEYSNLWKLIVDSDWNDPLLNIEFAALYNLSLDPGESNNLINDPSAATQLATMSDEYVQLVSSDRTAN
jgi:arylsulfatase A-like enzyme